jgi:hypothetical protein
MPGTTRFIPFVRLAVNIISNHGSGWSNGEPKDVIVIRDMQVLQALRHPSNWQQCENRCEKSFPLGNHD